MSTTLVEQSSAIDMIGPYLKDNARCPGCGHNNLFVHTESMVSPVKVVDVCTHIRAFLVDDNGVGQFEFEH
jgi:hypothetical protein